uniref:Sigma non-opioid intracellular receptor 1 n=1 Tax=Plectus sambesii TaxID=2011161 RepID=A0A914XGV6_9BILA
MAFLFTRLFRNIVLVLVLGSAVQFLLRIKSYTISPKDFRTISVKAAGSNGATSVQKLMADLRRTYGPHLIPENEQQWLPVSPGGAQLRVKFAHASFTEYLAIFSAPFTTSGRSGIHWVNSTCTVLTGSVSRYVDSPNNVNKEAFNPGDNLRHGQFESAVYELTADTHLACYGRGFIPVSALWLNAGSITNGDPIAIARLAYVYGGAMVRETMMWGQSTFSYYKNKALNGRSEL